MVLSLMYVFLDDKNQNFLSYLVSFSLTSLTRELFLPHPVLINSLSIKVEFLAPFSLPTSLTHRQHSQNCFNSNLFFVFCNFWASVAILLFLANLPLSSLLPLLPFLPRFIVYPILTLLSLQFQPSTTTFTFSYSYFLSPPRLYHL